jgi:amino acid adenylation domain-containing protein
MAVRLPEADTLEAFLHNLRTGRDSVRKFTTDRKLRTSLPLDEAYQLCGYLDDIDTFDYTFFNFSKGEAKTMAPQHRMLLQVSYQALENAGYDPASLRGSRASVYLADTKIGYDQLARTPEPTLVMGSHVSAMAGRIARFFDLRGPAAMIDTACSSSLVALHFAMNDLLLGESEVALVGCASLNLFADRLTGELDIGIRSPDGKTRCFSAEAEGTGSGEAVVVVVLKRHDHARRDGDVIHAVVKSVALNQVGGRASTLTAPDAESEAEVIKRAWAKAEIDPQTISFIEAHGTATRLGDPIEIEGIDQAFSRFTSRKNFCAISSVKSNIGHTWSAAGLVGVVKATLALRHHELFPNLHSANLSPLINFSNSAVNVTQQLTPWEPVCGVRRAGVSSFGVMGTNAHAILEEASLPQPVVPSFYEGARRYWIPVSARSAESLTANIDALRVWLQARPGLHLADVQRTLVGGRSHFEHRFSVSVADLTELDLALAEPAQHHCAKVNDVEVVIALVCSGHCYASPALTQALRRAHAHFDRLYGDCERASAGTAHPHVAQFTFQFAFQGWLRALGFKFRHLVGEGAGRHVIAAIRGRVTLSEAIRQSCNVEPEPLPLRTRVERMLAGFSEQRILFVEAGPLSSVTKLLQEEEFREVARSSRSSHGYDVVAVGDHKDALPQFLADLYRAGANWTFATCAGEGSRIELPGYQFQATRCWLDEVRVATNTAASATPDAGATDLSMDTLTEVRRIWKEILGLDEVNLDASFFALGGDSISGLQVVNHINAMFGTQLDNFAIIEHETLFDLAKAVDELRAPAPDRLGPSGEQLSVARPAPEPELFPASHAQVQIWLGAQFEGGSIAFNLTRSFQLTGHLDPARLQRAVNALVARHEALRVTFRMDDDVLMQRITPLSDFNMSLEIVHYDEPMLAQELQNIIRQFASRPFDLERGPLLRVHLLQLGRDSQVLMLSTHHIVVDGWSLDLLIRDLGAFVASDESTLPAITTSYREQFVTVGDGHMNGSGASADYWLTQYADIPPLLELPVRTERGSVAFQGAYLDCRLPKPLRSQLKKLSQEQGGTNFTALFALFAAFLSRYTENGHMVLGTSLVERGGQAAEQLVSMLVRIVPLRIFVAPTATLIDLYAQVRTTFGEALRHRSYSYEELVQELQQRGQLQSPHLFNVLIEFEQFGEVGKAVDAFLAGSGITATPLDTHLDTSVFPLNIMLSEQSDGFYAVFRFDTSLFDHEAIERMWQSFVEFTTVLLTEPLKPISALPLLTEAEARRIRTLGYRSLDFDASRHVHREIERHAVEQPDRVCLSSPDGVSTFAELNRRANQLARQFRDLHKVRPGDLVALVMDRSRLLVESILAVWKCGAAYMPVDPCYPPTFIASMLSSARVTITMYDPCQVDASVVDYLLKGGYELVDLSSRSAAEEDPSNLDIVVSASGLAYVIYTSGSTGVPKGAMVEHPGMLNHLQAKIADLALSERSIVAHNAPSSFDISVWQMFSAPLIGGQTVIYPQAVQLDPRKFTEELWAAAVSVLEVVPSYLNTMLEVWEQAGLGPKFTSLKYLLVTGEAIHPRLVNRWFDHFPTVPVVNAYGPTEASDDITHHVITGPIVSGSVPVGRPIPNTYIYLLDAERRVVPEGDVGDIYVSGICVGRGYLHDPEQTARVFTDDPFEPGRRMYRTGDRGRWTADGSLEFLGRMDNQVKVRGFRLDVGELERRLGECPGVGVAAVTTVPGANDQLCAYLVLQPGGSVDRCRAYLDQELPHYMIPAIFVELDKLPLTSNGKVDRKALMRATPHLTGTVTAHPHGSVLLSSVEAGTPYDRTLKALTAIWAEVLNRTDFDAEDSFFDLGGNSLRAIQVLSRIRARLKVDLPLESLFVQPRLSGLAAAVLSSRPTEVEPISSVGGPGTYPVAATQGLLLQIERDYIQRAAFNRNDLYRLHGKLNPDLLIKAFESLIEQHEILRTTFGSEFGSAVQIVHAPGALPLPFQLHDFTEMEDPNEATRQFVDRRIQTPFEIRSEPLIRADLLKTGPNDYALLVSMHQLISDGRSAQVLQENWLARYEGLVHGCPTADSTLSVQAKDVAAWQRQMLTQQQKNRYRAFWGSRLEGATSVIALHTDRDRPRIATLNGSRLRIPLPDSLTHQFAALAHELEITEFVVAQVAVSLLLLTCTGGTDITIGTYTRGRDRPELENQIGFYINTVPLRLRLRPEDELRILLVRAQKELLQAFEHQAYPYGWTMEDLGWHRGLDRSPLFDVMIAFDDLDDSEKHQHPDATLQFESVELPRRSKEADLLIAFEQIKDYLELYFTYNTDVFSPDLARRYAVRLREILTAMVEGRSISEILTQGKIT